MTNQHVFQQLISGDAGAACEQPLLRARIIWSEPVRPSEEHGERGHREEATEARRRQAQVPSTAVLCPDLRLL